jgi:hypothetical protein
MEESCLVLLRVEDGGRRRGVLLDRAGPSARILSETVRVANGANRELEVVS